MIDRTDRTITTSKNPWNRHRINRQRGWKSNQEIRNGGKHNIHHRNIKSKKNSTGKYGRNTRVQHFEERIEEVVAEEIRSIQTRAKQKEHDDMTKEV